MTQNYKNSNYRNFKEKEREKDKDSKNRNLRDIKTKKEAPVPMKHLGGNFIIIFVVVTAIFYLYEYFSVRKNIENLPYSKFVALVQEGKVKEVILAESKISGEFKDSGGEKGHYFFTVPVKDDHLIELLKTKGVIFQGEVASSFWGNLLSWIFLVYILSLLWSLF